MRNIRQIFSKFWKSISIERKITETLENLNRNLRKIWETNNNKVILKIFIQKFTKQFLNLKKFLTINAKLTEKFKKFWEILEI